MEIRSKPWHGCYGTLSYNDKNKRTIQEIVFPNTVNQIEAASFTGMTKLRELKMPEQITKVPSYAFAKCTVLSKVTFSNNMQSIASSAFLHSNQVKTFSCPKANKTFAVKKRNVDDKIRKNISACTKQDEKNHNPYECENKLKQRHLMVHRQQAL